MEKSAVPQAALKQIQENGTSDPNTSNLIALAKLYGISAEELLKNVENHLHS